jgi:hypothetical protein
MNILDSYLTCKCKACNDLRFWEVFTEEQVMKEFWAEKGWFFGDCA